MLAYKKMIYIYFFIPVDEEASQELDEPHQDQQSDSEECEDEGVGDLASEEDHGDPIDSLSIEHSVLSASRQVEEEESPALQDVLMSPRHLHLPGFEEVERLALLLLQLADDSNRHIVPPSLRREIATAASSLHEHDKSARKFVKRYQSKWGYTLFGRCLGPENPQSSAAQKTKFAQMRYAQASQITEESRLLYILIKMLKNRPSVSHYSSPTKTASMVLGHYKRIVDRLRDDPLLSNVEIPLPNINAKSVTNMLSKEAKSANLRATCQPKVKPHKRVFSDETMPDAPSLPSSLPPLDRPQVQYPSVDLITGKRRHEKRRLDFDVEETEHVASSSTGAIASPSTLRQLQPRPTSAQVMPSGSSNAPILLVVPSQPQAPSVLLQPSTSQVAFTYKSKPSQSHTPKPVMPNKSRKPCSACKIAQCGGLKKRYTPSKEKCAASNQKMFTFCPRTRKSTTPGFGGVFNDFEHFKRVVDEELQRRKGK